MTMTNNAASSLKPIKRVAIIGSGICGLSLAHALTNNSCRNSATSSTTTVTTRGGDDEKIDVCLYDSREFLDCKSGAGVQLTGGLSALKKINPALYREVYDTGLPLKTIRSRAKPWFTSTSSNKSDGDFSTLLELGLEETIKKAGGDTRKKLITLGKDGKGEEVMATAIMRGALQETLFKNLPKETSDNVKFGKTLVGIKPAKAAATEGKGGIICVFEDGSEDGPFDMVVGSDGINSAVKEYVDTGNITIDGKKRETTIYSGIRIQYAVQDGQPEDEQKDSAELVQYFGDAAYSLAGLYGVGKNKKPTKAAYLIFKDKNYIGTIKKIRKTATRQEPSENSDWNQETESVGSLMYSRMKDCGVPDQQVGPIIQNSDRFFELGVYFHNPFSFNGWSREVRGNGNGGNCYAVLAGDAAHAMPPFLGQGANQAVQDSYCLATTIFQHNDDIRRRLSTDNKCLSVEGELKRELSLRILLKEYERKRWVPTASITFKSIFLGYLETGEDGFLSKFRDSFFKVA
eukprot:CAMPEP_0194374204 /NCGR_PEP_ID=MMETSP0174-20130528/22580_1 /TAXON_ID=216777 /ORGANISM="Proboscia alata, Strain PI-D3" /LENGTH=516 /DNA_ID=CAMNT_0039153617 /DNA_START=222 /DNA_END=1769 /DNA_ORIENTATION=-